MKKQDEARQVQLEVDKMRREAGTEALQAIVESKVRACIGGISLIIFCHDSRWGVIHNRSP